MRSYPHLRCYNVPRHQSPTKKKERKKDKKEKAFSICGLLNPGRLMVQSWDLLCHVFSLDKKRNSTFSLSLHQECKWKRGEMLGYSCDGLASHLEEEVIHV